MKNATNTQKDNTDRHTHIQTDRDRQTHTHTHTHTQTHRHIYIYISLLKLLNHATVNASLWYKRTEKSQLSQWNHTIWYGTLLKHIYFTKPYYTVSWQEKTWSGSVHAQFDAGLYSSRMPQRQLYPWNGLSLRKHAYSNILRILPPKYKNFQMKNSDIFLISAQNIDCGYSLEPPRRGGSNEYP